MKISKIFHWLYFTVMMLPCFIIPIFAIYTRNENYNSNIEVQVQESEYVNFNQLLNNKDQTFTGNNYTITCEDNIYYINGYTTVDWLQIKTFNDVSLVNNHIYLIREYPFVNNAYEGAYIQINYRNENNQIVSQTTRSLIRIQWLSTYQFINISLQVGKSNINYNYSFTLGMFDLTQMYGEGNEPTNDVFLQQFPNPYYEYTLSKTERIDGIIRTYNDTDVGSQFVYTLYNATDKYFNFDNFFGLNNVYSWIQLNWFSGNAPLGFAIFWHFFTYWLLASLAWLLFDLMVYVPLFIHRWLDKGAIE